MADSRQMLVEELQSIKNELASNYFVARCSVSAEVDAPDEILLLLVELHRQVDDFLFFVDFRVRLGSEIDESVFAVNFPVGLQGLANFLSGKDVALFERESAFQRINLEGQGLVWIGADDLQRAHAVALAFFDGDGDIDGLAVAMPCDQRDAQAVTLSVDVFENGLANGNLEIAVVAI